MRELARRGVRVVVLDVLPLRYEMRECFVKDTKRS